MVKMNSKQYLKNLLSKEHRKKTALVWSLLNIGYDIARTIIVGNLFKGSGINIYLYLIYVLVFSAIFSYCSFCLVTSIVDRRRNQTIFFGSCSIFSFFAPDMYILIIGRNISWLTYTLLAGYLCLTVTATTYSIYRDVRQKRVSSSK